MGWEALEQWGDDVVRVEPLAGGAGANEVWSVRVSGHPAVARLGRRSDGDLAWETGLLRHLGRAGMPVPAPVATTDGRYSAGGLVVMTYLEGGPPETKADWRRVAETLRQLHRLTQGWPQRPGWRSSTGLLHAETGTRVDLGAMPPMRTTLPCRRGPRGKPPSAGTPAGPTSSPSGGSPKSARSEQPGPGRRFTHVKRWIWSESFVRH